MADNIYTAQEAHDAKIAQIADLAEKLDAVGAAIAAMEQAAPGGVVLWLGGVSEPITQVKQQADFQVRRLRELFLTPSAA